MDVDQAARSNAQEYFGVKDPDFYEFEGTNSCIVLLYECDCNTCVLHFQHMCLLMMEWKIAKQKRLFAITL